MFGRDARTGGVWLGRLLPTSGMTNGVTWIAVI